MEEKPVTDVLLKVFNGMFILVIASFFLADALRAARMGPYSLVVVLIPLIPWAVALGVAARRLGRSPALWCGLSLVTLPFGLFIGHVLMFRRLKAALAAQAQAPIGPTASAAPQKPDANARGVCPSCNAEIPLDSSMCPNCRATFGGGSAYKINPL